MSEPERKSGILAAVQESASALHEAGVKDAMTMKEVDALCLAPTHDYSPAELKALRETRLRVSQAVLATFLGVSRDTVAHWEQGVNKPRGPALRLLNLAERKGLEALV